jgi:hypothetical protein
VKKTSGILRGFFLLLDLTEASDPLRLPAGVNNPQDKDFGCLYLIDEQPVHADRLSVNFCFCWDLPALPKSQGVLLNAINGQENLITDPDGSQWLMLDVSFWSFFFCVAHRCLASARLTVGEPSAYSTHFLKSSSETGSPGKEKELRSGSLTILIKRLCSSSCSAFSELLSVSSILIVCITSSWINPLLTKIGNFMLVFPITESNWSTVRKGFQRVSIQG